MSNTVSTNHSGGSITISELIDDCIVTGNSAASNNTSITLDNSDSITIDSGGWINVPTSTWSSPTWSIGPYKINTFGRSMTLDQLSRLKEYLQEKYDEEIEVWLIADELGKDE